eukprot:57122-Eustigmatos_ZCMA.PRE.1
MVVHDRSPRIEVGVELCCQSEGSIQHILLHAAPDEVEHPAEEVPARPDTETETTQLAADPKDLPRCRPLPPAWELCVEDLYHGCPLVLGQLNRHAIQVHHHTQNLAS